MPAKHLALVVVLVLPTLDGCGENKLTAADQLTVKLRTEARTTRVEDAMERDVGAGKFLGRGVRHA